MRHAQPEGCGSIDSALLGLRYLSTLSGIAAKHASPEQEHSVCLQQAPEGDVQSVAAPSSGYVLLAHPMQTYALLCCCTGSASKLLRCTLRNAIELVHALHRHHLTRMPAWQA